MKKMYLLLSLSLVCLVGSAQQYTPKYVHCLLMGQVKLNGQIKVVIDYGDTESTNADYLVSQNDENMNFNSMVAAMNYMGTHGWEFVQAYTVSVGQASVYHYLMRKPYNELAPDVQKLYKWE